MAAAHPLHPVPDDRSGDRSGDGLVDRLDHGDGPVGCTISCGDCRLRGTSACEECVVTFLLGPEVVRAVERHPAAGRRGLPIRSTDRRRRSGPHEAQGADPGEGQDGPEVHPVAEVRLDPQEADVLRLFQDAGMAPVSRHVRRVG